ncbi:MAG TPA: glycosyltransferase family 1 protein [Bryobacteraceae bacterium]|nr:glycosyltransferase family 1 protein [Bryobacteraceae bacterium]
MRIGIDASPLLLRSAGVKTWTWHWVENLRKAAAGTGDVVDSFPSTRRNARLVHEGSIFGPLATWPRLALLYALNAPSTVLLDRLSGRFDVVHLSNQIRRRPRTARVTATVHDMTCWLMPELHTEANVRADREFAERVLRGADSIIAVSENTRLDAIRLLDLPPEKVEVIYSGVAGEFFDAKPRESARPYVLFVGTIEPRKNLDTLLDAWALLKPSLHEEFDLLVAGPEGWGATRTMARLRSGGKNVRYLGYVSEPELPSLTAGATLFVYPSLYEGFGFPVAQAMAARVPAITSNLSSLPEIAAAGSVLVDPRSADELHRGLELLLTSPALRAKLARDGNRQAQQFRWEICARKSLEFFQRLT